MNAAITKAKPRVGILALQGAVREHARVLVDLGAQTTEVRTRADLEAVDMLVLPGGESTTMSLLLETSGLLEPLRSRLRGGMPTFGTCAGMILLAADVADGRPDQHHLGAIDIGVRRNAFGRQVDSFETELDIAGLDLPFHAVFIRSPVVERVGPGVQVLATVTDSRVGDGRLRRDLRWLDSASPDPPSLDEGAPDVEPGGRPVLCQQGPVLVAAFHPELSGDPRLHEMFLSRALANEQPAST